MSESSKHHFYHYTARSIAFADVGWCGGKILMYVVPPEKALTIENISIHFKATFDAAIPSGQRIVKSVSIVDKIPLMYNSNSDVNYIRTLQLNTAADATTRKVDMKLDISHLLKKDNVGYRELFGDSAMPNLTYVMIEPDDALIGNTNIGRIDLWKIDAQFTTQGIR